MRIGENYLIHNPAPEKERLNPVDVAWRSLLAATQVFVPGDDLSHWNTINNWFLKQTEMKYSVLKLGEGNQVIPDEDLFGFAEQALASNTQVMGYWFFRSNYAGELQWANCLNIAISLSELLGYKPVIWADVETSDGVGNSLRISRLGTFLSGVNAWNPGKAGVYSSPGFANTYLTPTPAYINTNWQWVAHWTSAALPTQPNGWNAAMRKLWQIGYWDGFSWCPPVPGAQPDVDRNKFFGDESALTTFTGALAQLTLEERVAYLESIAHSH